MKYCVLIALVIVGVTSDTEVSSAKHANHERISTSLKTSRREGIGYSTSVIHRDPAHPELEAESSINFKLNTDHKHVHKPYLSHSSPLHEGSAPNYYTTPQYDFISSPHSYPGSSQTEEYTLNQSIKEQSLARLEPNNEVIYGKSSGDSAPSSAHATSPFFFEQSHQNVPPVQPSQRGHSSKPHPNHQEFYQQTYAQPVFTETAHNIRDTNQFKQGPNSSGRSISTSRPKATSQSFRHSPSRANYASLGSHSHQSVHKLPMPEAYTQVIYPGTEGGKSGKAITFSHLNQNLNHHSPDTGSSGHEENRQTQSFNVGYSVKFGNEQGGSKKKPFKVTRPDSDIITGSHKEEVSKPTHLPSHYHYATNHHQQQADDSKYFSSTSTNKQILSQANLTPKTQKQLAFLENIQSHKFNQKEPVQNNFPWKNLSPSVEIYRSKDITLPGSTKTYIFDHDKAIGKSEGFDYTNAVDFNGNIVKLIQQGSASNGQSTAYLPISNSQGHETQQVQVQGHLELQPQVDAQLPYVRISDVSKGNDKISPLHKLSIDTSLLREPFLTVHKDKTHGHGSQLPIHFDTSLIKNMRHAYGQIVSANDPTIEPGSSYQNNPFQINNLVAEQSQQNSNYQQLSSAPSSNPETSAPLSSNPQQNSVILLQSSPSSHSDEMTFAYPQNGLFNPLMAMVPKSSDPTQMPVVFNPQGKIKAIDSKLLQHLKMYKVKENAPDHAQPTMVKYKVFGKPGNAYMRHQYEKMRPGLPIRAPAHGGHSSMQASDKRHVREYTNIEMDLRPPPMSTPFQTANFMRVKQ